MCSLQPYYNRDYLSDCAASVIKFPTCWHHGAPQIRFTVRKRKPRFLLGEQRHEKTRRSHKTRLTRSTEQRSSTKRAGFSSPSLTCSPDGAGEGQRSLSLCTHFCKQLISESAVLQTALSGAGSHRYLLHTPFV